jgi:hypothetical protein
MQFAVSRLNMYMCSAKTGVAHLTVSHHEARTNPNKNTLLNTASNAMFRSVFKRDSCTNQVVHHRLSTLDFATGNLRSLAIAMCSQDKCHGLAYPALSQVTTIPSSWVTICSPIFIDGCLNNTLLFTHEQP